MFWLRRNDRLFQLEDKLPALERAVLINARDLELAHRHDELLYQKLDRLQKEIDDLKDLVKAGMANSKCPLTP